MFGPSWLIESRSDWSKPRISDVMPTIDVMPMTTPSTVSAERILLRAHGVERHRDDFARAARDANAPSLFPSAALRSDRARGARIAGYSPKNRPTSAVMPMPSATDHSSTDGRKRRERR